MLEELRQVVELNQSLHFHLPSASGAFPFAQLTLTTWGVRRRVALKALRSDWPEQGSVYVSPNTDPREVGEVPRYLRPLRPTQVDPT